MRLLVKKMIIFIIPVLVYLGLFLLYEPHNYWGLKPERSGQWSKPMARARAFLREPSENIILGDSRMNHFELDYVEELSGRRYQNLSTGGQAPNLSLALYEWVKGKTDIRELVLDVSFYEDRLGSKNEPVDGVLYLAEHPLEYIANKTYIKEAYDLFVADLKSGRFTPLKSSGLKDIVFQPSEAREESYGQTKYRKDLMDYAMNTIYEGVQSYQLSRENLGYLIQISEDVKNGGGRCTFVTPPVQESIWDYVIEPLELEPRLDEYKDILSHSAPILDFEWKNAMCREQSFFSDGFHFDHSQAYREFTEVIFGGARSENVRLIPEQEGGIERLDWDNYTAQ